MPRLSSIIFLVMVPLIFFGCAPRSSLTNSPTPTPPTLPSPTPPPGFRIIGYATEDAIPELIPYEKLTHINYAFVTPNADGTFRDVLNPWKLKSIVEMAHQRGVKVLVSVGGWGWDAQFEALAANPETRSRFVAGLVDYANEYQLDGLDIDWEYPDPGVSAQNFLALMQELRTALPKDKLLTAAVVALGATGEGILADTFDTMDFVNIMAYDGSDSDHSPVSYAQSALSYWADRGLPPEKTVLGVPFYARPNWVPYRKLVTSDPAAANTDSFEYFSQTVYYNGIPTMQQKTALAMENASGIMIWALSHDTNDETSLLSAIYQAVHKP